MTNYYDLYKVIEISEKHHNLYLWHKELMKQADEQIKIMDETLYAGDFKFFYDLWLGHKYKNAKKKFNDIIKRAKDIEKEQELLIDQISEIQKNKENNK